MGTGRQIRVFLSSTFVDMQEERDYLIKKIFPSIKAECRRRRVDFVALDLRWGINEEAAKSGKVVEICMDEIVRSRPFFIGLVGGRYGWIPEENEPSISERLLAKYPWIKECIAEKMSITEMEMQFGVLRHPTSVNAYFFQKADAAVPRKYRERKGSDKAKRLEELKSEIRQAAEQGKCKSQTYFSLESLGKQVYEALMAAINELYPVEEHSRYHMLSMMQNEYLEGLRKVYIRYGDEPELVGNVIVTGPHGIGKSALVANRGACGMQEDTFLIYTVVNNEVNTAEECRRLFLYELSRYVEGIDLSVLDADGYVDLKRILNRVGFAGKVRWVIDGFDRLSSEVEVLGSWLNDLPPQLSEVILTVTDASALSSTVVKRFTKIEVNALNPGEIVGITREFLAAFSKSLSVSQEFHISNAAVLTVPEVLKLFLKELIQFGIYEQLDGFLNDYLDVESVCGFYDKLLGRFDADFGYEKMRLLFGSLIMCRSGLPEDEMIRLLGLKNIEWAAICDAVSPFVVSRFGYLFMEDASMTDSARKHYGVDSMSQDKILVRKLIRMLKKGNRAILKESYSRKDENPAWKERLVDELECFVLQGAGVPGVDGQRICLNVILIVNLLKGIGDMRKAGKVARRNIFALSTSTVLESIGIIREMFVDKRVVRFADALTFGIVFLCGYMGDDVFIVNLLDLLGLGGEDFKVKEEERICRKIRRMPLRKERKRQLISLISPDKGGGVLSLDEIFERDDWHRYGQDILARCLEPFYFSDKESLKSLFNKVEAAYSSADSPVRDLCLLVMAHISLSLKDDRADGYMTQFLQSPLAVDQGGEIILLYTSVYDIIVAIRRGKIEGVRLVLERVSELNDGVTYFCRFIYCLVNAIAVATSPQRKVSNLSFDEWQVHRKDSADDVVELILEFAGKNPSHETCMGIWNIGQVLSNLGEEECAFHAFKIAFDIRKDNPVVGDALLYNIYLKLEQYMRRTGRAREALSLSVTVMDLCANGTVKGDVVRLQNVIGVNAHQLMRTSTLPLQERVAFFHHAYAAYSAAAEIVQLEASKASLKYSRAMLVFDAAEFSADLAAGYIDMMVSEMEDVVAGLEDKAQLKMMCETLATGYRLAGRWKELGQLYGKYGVQTAEAVKYECQIIYHASDDHDAALAEIAHRIFTVKLDRFRKPDSIQLLKEIVHMGLAEAFADRLEREYHEGSPDSVMYAVLMIELGNLIGDSSVEARGEKLVASFLENEEHLFSYYGKLKKLLPVAEILVRCGKEQSEVDEIQALLSFRSFTGGDIYAANAFENVLRSSGALERIMEMMAVASSEISKSEDYDETGPALMYSVVCPLYENREAVANLLADRDDELADRFRESAHDLLLVCSDTSQYKDADWPHYLFEVRKAFGLKCDRRLIWQHMLMCTRPEYVVSLWEDYPDCHQHIGCQAQYILALRQLHREAEAERELDRFFSEAQVGADLTPLNMQYVNLMRNRGQYAQVVTYLEDNVEDIGNSPYAFTYELSLAYAGRPADALLMLERNWHGNRHEYYMRAIFLLMQGLAEDAEKVASMIPPLPYAEEDWTKVLYLLQLARYWKDKGEEEKARDSMAVARECMSSLPYLPMCEYEAAKLGL